jgi:hypothetical protein
MSSRLPGTTIEAELSTGAAERALTPLFYSGGLVLSQVSLITGLEGYIIQNWVKRQFLPPPVRKKYSRRQLCRILCINVLKDTFTLEQTATLLGYINGVLADESDDLIDDSLLYTYFVDCLAETGDTKSVIERVTRDYTSPNPDADGRLFQVLEIMLTAYEAQRVRGLALEQFSRLDSK